MTTAIKNIRFLLFLSLCVVMVSCQDRDEEVEDENSILELSLSNTYDEDLYIFLNVWHASELDKIEDVADIFSLSRFFIVNKIIYSKERVEFNQVHNYPFIKTVALTNKEPVFLEFNKSDSVKISLKTKKLPSENPVYIQLIAFSKNEINESSKEFLVFRKKEINLNLVENWRPFEDNEMLDSARQVYYYDSLEVIPIELVINQ